MRSAAENFQAVRHYISPPDHWVQVIQSHHWLMSTYIAESAGTPLPNSVSHESTGGRRGILTPVVRSRIQPANH